MNLNACNRGPYLISPASFASRSNLHCVVQPLIAVRGGLSADLSAGQAQVEDTADRILGLLPRSTPTYFRLVPLHRIPLLDSICLTRVPIQDVTWSRSASSVRRLHPGTSIHSPSLVIVIQPRPLRIYLHTPFTAPLLHVSDPQRWRQCPAIEPLRKSVSLVHALGEGISALVTPEGELYSCPQST